MLQKNVRFLLVLLFLVLGVVIHIRQGIGGAWYLYAAALLLLATYFLFGNVWSAFSLLKKGKLAQAEHIVDQIKRPEWLLKKHRAYYHFIKGMATLQHKEFAEAEQHLQSALQLGLRTPNDTALVNLNLAHLCLRQKRNEEARHFLQEAKKLPFNDLMMKDKIAEMERALAT